MKKLLCVVLSLCFMFSLVSCGNNMSFDSEEEMFAHLNGIWQCGEEYYIFDDGTVCEVNDSAIVYDLKKYFVEYIKGNGYDAYATLGQDEALNAIKPSVLESYKISYTANPKKSIIVFQAGSEFEVTMTLTEDQLQGEDGVYTKLSDAVDFSNEHFGKCFTSAINQFKPSPDDFVLSLDKCTEKLKSYHSEINSYIAVNDEMWTDTGSAGVYNGTLLRPKGSLVFSKKFGSEKYTYSYMPSGNDRVTVVTDTSGTQTMTHMVRDALVFISEYPLALSANELVDRYNTESTVGEFGTLGFTVSVEGIKYEIYKTSGSTTVRIEIL